MSEGAQIYSTDSDFNSWFLSKENTDYEINISGNVFTFKPKKQSAKKQPEKKQVKISVSNTERQNLRKIKKQISDFEQRKKLFNYCAVYGGPVSAELPDSHFNRSYTVPSVVSNNFSKAGVFRYYVLIRLIL